jgi:hypothetical protein
MESNIISAEIAEHGDNSLGCSLKTRCGVCDVPKCEHSVWLDRSPRGWTHNFRPEDVYDIRQYMRGEAACGKDVNKPEPFPSILESAEQARRVKRNREIK